MRSGYTVLLQWDVEPWGSWRVYARNAEYEALVEAKCESPGTPLRAPTADRGLDVFCRDSFFGQACHASCRALPSCSVLSCSILSCSIYFGRY